MQMALRFSRLNNHLPMLSFLLFGVFLGKEVNVMGAI